MNRIFMAIASHKYLTLLVVGIILLIVLLLKWLTYDTVAVNILGKQINVNVPTGIVFNGKVSNNTAEQKAFEEKFFRMYYAIKDSIKYPHEALQERSSGLVKVQFTVNVNGELTEIKVIKGVNKFLDEEAVRVVKLCPQWEPIIINGKPSKQILTIPIYFLPLPPSPEEP